MVGAPASAGPGKWKPDGKEILSCWSQQQAPGFQGMVVDGERKGWREGICEMGQIASLKTDATVLGAGKKGRKESQGLVATNDEVT